MNDIFKKNWHKEIKMNPWVRNILHNYPLPARNFIADTADYIYHPTYGYVNESREHPERRDMLKYYENLGYIDDAVNFLAPNTYDQRDFELDELGNTDAMNRAIHSERSYWHNLTKFNLPLYTSKTTKSKDQIPGSSFLDQRIINRNYLKNYVGDEKLQYVAGEQIVIPYTGDPDPSIHYKYSPYNSQKIWH